VWPAALVDEFHSEVSLVVRLECALHPAVGKSVAELEAASIERLTVLIAESKKERARRKGRNATPGPYQRQLARLHGRAYEHVESATRALAKARGDVPCVVPGWVEKKPEACE
jgi:phosphate uptake regulator